MLTSHNVRYVVLNWLERLFWKTLCTQPDGNRFQMWWYHHSGNIARFFHRHKGCKQCRT